jgi:N-acetylneuraminate synthase
MTFVIAEIGSNYDTFEDAKDSISKAKQQGADAVKFQLADRWALYGDEDGKDCKIREWLPALAEKAEACGIKLMCSVFHPDDVEFVDNYVFAHKVATSEANWPQLIEAVAKCNKPTFVTVAGCSNNEIDAIIAEFATDQLCIMYSSPEYPSAYHNLFEIDRLKRFGVPVGFSDHSKDVIYAPLSAAYHFGCEVIEKHVNLAGVVGTDDAAVSLDAEEFGAMIKALRGDDSAGKRVNKPLVERWRRRLKAKRDIEVGDVLTYGDNFGAYRSRETDIEALSPAAWQEIEGKQAKLSRKAGDPIGPAML